MAKPFDKHTYGNLCDMASEALTNIKGRIDHDQMQMAASGVPALQLVLNELVRRDRAGEEAEIAANLDPAVY